MSRQYAPTWSRCPRINPPSRRLPLLGNQKFALSYDAVRPSENFQPLGDHHQVVKGERFSGPEPFLFSRRRRPEKEHGPENQGQQAENYEKCRHWPLTKR